MDVAVARQQQHAIDVPARRSLVRLIAAQCVAIDRYRACLAAIVDIADAAIDPVCPTREACDVAIPIGVTAIDIQAGLEAMAG